LRKKVYKYPQFLKKNTSTANNVSIANIEKLINSKFDSFKTDILGNIDSKIDARFDEVERKIENQFVSFKEEFGKQESQQKINSEFILKKSPVNTVIVPSSRKAEFMETGSLMVRYVNPKTKNKDNPSNKTGTY